MQTSNILVYVAICSIVGSLSGALLLLACRRRRRLLRLVAAHTCCIFCRYAAVAPPATHCHLLSVHTPLTVMSCKALGIALKLTFEGDNQMIYPQTYAFMLVVASAVVTQVCAEGWRGG